MATLIAKCGIDCGACPWGPYPRQGLTTEDFDRFRANAKRILGYMPIKTPCLTCQTPDAQIPKGSRLPNRSCLIRRCVDASGMVNCAYCTHFPCDTTRATGGAWTRTKIEAKLGEPLSDEEYHTFIEPFEGLSRLEALQASLKPEELREPAAAATSETPVTDFPEALPFSTEENAAFKAVHTLLATVNQSSLGLQDPHTFAQQHTLAIRRAHVLRFLWILGRYGQVEAGKPANLVVDAETYDANRGREKTLAIWSFVQDLVFTQLSGLGVRCQRVVLHGVKADDLVTGTGYLRSRGWVMTMAFEERIGGAAALKALQTYTRRLDEHYGNRAFQHFSHAEMHVLRRQE